MSIAQRNEIEALKKRMQIIEDGLAAVIANQAKIEQRDRQYDPAFAPKTLSLPDKKRA